MDMEELLLVVQDATRRLQEAVSSPKPPYIGPETYDALRSAVVLLDYLVDDILA
jgi:hypothetical protein